MVTLHVVRASSYPSVFARLALLPVVGSLSLPCPSLGRRLEMPRLHPYRLSMSGASPMLDSAQSPTRQTTFTFGSPDLTVEDAQPYLLLAQPFGHCSLQRASATFQQSRLS